ncbi:4-oxalomesaconate tautomerase [Pandoraea cepalis]|uniref:4-oxalomesaconate tautomerase n=1 Tax=Pandoraea cepalis TaxID=2508294 RepID=A0A5E4RQ47_9BURK|nr:4-oxalomesaconate tautomerase [Pandoraea cepalis]VVD65520.1 4-oxalomesaconate tautomerase [Pandoraea cepalis]
MTHSQTRIRAAVMRGGTSKGLYFLAEDLPAQGAARDAVLLAAMGSPDARQIDGMGGANPLTSKVAIVSRATRPDADVDYLFAQVVVDEARVDYGQNCGNLLAGVGPFAIERGLVSAPGNVTDVGIHMLNTGQVAVATVQTPRGMVKYDGDVAIDGVPGTAAPIPLMFRDTAGSSCGALFPTGQRQDVVDGITVTCIDNGMPLVLLRAADLGITGAESCEQLDSAPALQAMRDRIEAIRLAVGPRMHLGDVRSRTVPKMCLVAPPKAGGALATRCFIPHRCHSSIGVLAAVSVATAAALPGTVCHAMAVVPDNDAPLLAIEHPTGEFTVRLALGVDADGAPDVAGAGLLRTARWLFDGEVCIPNRAWPQGGKP